MQRRGKINGFITVVLIVALLAGMILATVLLSRSNSREWTYSTADSAFDYYSPTADTGYVENFKASVRSFFEKLINNNLAKYIGISDKLNQNLDRATDRIVSAMSAARVSEVKLNRIAGILNDNSPQTIYNEIVEFFSQFENSTELEEYLYSNAPDFSLFSIFLTYLNQIINKSGLTENELAKFVYHYLLQNNDEKYLSYLGLIGEEYFVTLFSNTVYALTTISSISDSEFQLSATSASIKSVLYELGSLYANIASMENGTEAFERIFYATWDYDDFYGNQKELNRMSQSIRGEIGAFFVVFGQFLRQISREGIEEYCKYVKAIDEKEKSDHMIYSAYLLSSSFESAIQNSAKAIDKETQTIQEFGQNYANVLNTMSKISMLLFESAVNTEEEMEQIEATEFVEFGEAAARMLDRELVYSDIRDLEFESEGYQTLLADAKDFYKIKIGMSSFLSYILMIWFTNELNSYSNSLIGE